MKHRETIRKTAYSSIIAAVITVIIMVGSVLDIVDLAAASLCALIIHIVYNETGWKSAFLIFAVSSCLSLILMPMRSCPILFVFFFGYYPILRAYLYKRIKIKALSYTIIILLYNSVMFILFTLFKSIFGITEEPVYMYVLLLITSNVFFISFELLMRRIMILYTYKIKKMFKLKGNKK